MYLQSDRFLWPIVLPHINTSDIFVCGPEELAVRKQVTIVFVFSFLCVEINIVIYYFLLGICVVDKRHQITCRQSAMAWCELILFVVAVIDYHMS
jgi:uncharacterized membrane protein SirB2